MTAMPWPVASIERPIGAHDVAMLLGLHPNSVKRIPADELPFFRVGSRGDRRYLRPDVQGYIAARREGRNGR